MSLDLTFLPIVDKGATYSHSVIEVGTNYAWFGVFEVLVKKIGVPVHEDFKCLVARGSDGESAYGECLEDAYGKRLRTIKVKDILDFLNNNSLGELSNRTNAVFAYIKALTLDTDIVIYWS